MGAILRSPPPRRLSSRAGFTLFEIAVVALIIGILTRLAVPAVRRTQQNARFSVLMSDFRTIAQAFQQYYSVNGKWPADQPVGVKSPAGMAGFLRNTNWGQPTIIGGYYNWDYNVVHNGRRRTAVIAIYSDRTSPLKVTSADLLAFDRKYDDGNLSTGFFQLGYRNAPIFIIEN